MIADSLIVQFFGPYFFDGDEAENVFTNSLSKKKGVYLLAIPFDDNFWYTMLEKLGFLLPTAYCNTFKTI